MHCEPITIPDKDGEPLRGWICGDRRRARCQTPGCRRPGGFQCDFPLERGREPKTCDRHMCAAHRRPQPRLGTDKDYCPVHDDLSQKIARSVVAGLGARW